MGFNEIVTLKNKLSFQRCMKWYVKPKSTHAFILHLFPMIKSLPNVSILYQLDHLTNFQINTRGSLQFKPISNLIMICYHQNLIKRTLGLTKTNIIKSKKHSFLFLTITLLPITFLVSLLKLFHLFDLLDLFYLLMTQLSPWFKSRVTYNVKDRMMETKYQGW